jgi:phosphoenolpyruvate carboxykinase (diphosphate)
LNAALVSQILTAQPAFISAAGYVGPKARVDHDVSLLIPEVWSRMTATEREPKFLLDHGYLEKCEDLEWEGRKILASRLGYRITAKFARVFFGRVFTHPHSIFAAEMLRPELQDMSCFVDGMDNICATHERVALHYFADDTIALACPPLKALLHIMAKGSYEGKGLDAPEVRGLFTREALLASDWYDARLKAKQQADVALWTRHRATLHAYVHDPANGDTTRRLALAARLETAREWVACASAPGYLKSLRGTLGRQPL